ncbi:TerB family tellurite resistance protein [Pontibacter sp. HSC-14F20]|uniref:TerB family tellurite resistance protein n=1 Tax=Pontibacter sp. HSC-14F20 TaxID=2864136 RepID=UPI001C73AB63|nr:TerB family tellurite resistance protein [Pontibacter sp. HSC-14F20]MBX0335366.1 TerB family tellurite resistance protein [Pontibacter sp. HSC-14F20]
MKYLYATLLLLFLGAGLPQRAKAQADEIQQLLLNVEKLRQLKSILTDMKQGYDILHRGYGTVRDISEGSFSLHDAFLAGLLEVSPTVRHYRRVGETIALQQRLVAEYRSAYRRFREAGTFTPGELAYLSAVYDQLLAESLRHLEELVLVLTSGELRMAEAERLEAIDRLYEATTDKLAFLRHFNRQTSRLALQRARERNDVQTVQRLLLPSP